ncbi:tyrosine--tRNA ligase [candidate division KSB1 bacterium]|nr:tyrosine--tRNA ligase [candidate division KSB1 bacterium]
MTLKTDNVYDELSARGFIQQVTDPEPVRKLLRNEAVTFYVGIDPTADSLHAGHLMAVMGMANMQHYGHRPIAILGGGTAMVGDPSGKTEMRKMLTREQIRANGEKIKSQLARYLDFSAGKALLIDNYEWLGPLNYIEFLRDIGRHFSVNRMLTFETYKRRMETGLSFLEFNYQLLQAYDYYMLYKRYSCKLQMGGDDQWANILAGADLIRRIEGMDAYGLTFPLLTTASGAKMGKTEKGALWLDADKTSPFDYFQYWINVDDRDVARFLMYFTFLPAEEIVGISSLEGHQLNAAKTVLAFEATRLTHGEEEAKKALAAAASLFGGRTIPTDLLPSSTIARKVEMAGGTIPQAEMARKELEVGQLLVDVMCRIGLTRSKGEARRLIQQGGVYVNDTRVQDVEMVLGDGLVQDGKITMRLGKKRYFQLLVV